MNIPVIAIDGTAGSGKGLLCLRLANTLGFNLLDSGALYRLVALRIRQLRLDVNNLDVDAVSLDIDKMQVQFALSADGARTHLDGVDVDNQIRSEVIAKDAAAVAVIAQIRSSLLPKQRGFACPPGLVADGRDMGSRVFPEAPMKFYLSADPAVASERRWRQLRDIGIDSDREALQQQIHARDERDRNRTASPLTAADDAVIIDTTTMMPDQVFDLACSHLRRRSLMA